MQMSTPVTLVVAPEGMSDEHLLLHINGRHPSVWPRGEAPLVPRVAPDEVRRGGEFTLVSRFGWVILHERLHRDEWSLGHRHE